MSILTVTNLSHSFGEKVLYDQASLDLYRGEHLGLVGQNGAGKSTFLSSIIGSASPDGGKITWHPRTKVGYLDQHADMNLEQTIREYLQTSFQDLYEIELRLEENLTKLEQAYDEKLLNKVLSDQAALEDGGFSQINTKVGRVATGLGLDAFGLDTKLSKLSGGQRAKVILTKLLLDEPTILLLDEPTNFLDTVHVAWLKNYLKNYPQAFILISHDVDFLNDVTSHICHIERGQMIKYTGNYDAFVKQRDLKADEQASLFAKQKREIDKTKDYIARHAARASSAAQAQSRIKKLNKMKIIDAPTVAVRPNFSFMQAALPYGQVLDVKELQIGYEKPLLPQLNFSITSGQKIAISGFNGIGKSTLLKTLMGEINALNGKFEFSSQAKIAYFSQDLAWDDPRATPLDIMCGSFPSADQGKLRGNLAKYGIKATHIRQPIVSLSGGEQAKVKICALALQASNILILDEPTNHLDTLAKEALQKALVEFDGSVILVSHEPSFYQDWVQKVIKVGD